MSEFIRSHGYLPAPAISASMGRVFIKSSSTGTIICCQSRFQGMCQSTFQAALPTFAAVMQIGSPASQVCWLGPPAPLRLYARCAPSSVWAELHDSPRKSAGVHASHVEQVSLTCSFKFPLSLKRGRVIFTLPRQNHHHRACASCGRQPRRALRPAPTRRFSSCLSCPSSYPRDLPLHAAAVWKISGFIVKNSSNETPSLACSSSSSSADFLASFFAASLLLSNGHFLRRQAGLVDSTASG